jgi:uncharacterized protein
MNIVIAGGSGLLGRKLAATLVGEGHRVVTLTRRARPGVDTDVAWRPDGTAGPWAAALERADALINLAGEGIADRRWTAARKAALRESRLLSTRSLVAAVRACATPPRVFISSSAIGYYGPHGDEAVTEVTSPGTDFLAAMCVEWETEALRASGRESGVGSRESATRVVVLRTGIVLDPDGGALKQMLLPFGAGLGARLGSGRQFMPWIHVRDWIALVTWLLANDTAHGAFNATAPAPVTNAEFTRTLGRVLGRPAFFRAPAFALRIALGEFASFLLEGQRVLPVHAEQLGFAFRFRELEPALRDLLT